MQLEPGMRVRCVDAGDNTCIVNGGEYRVRKVYDHTIGLEGIGFNYYPSRFRPVVRVKMGAHRTGLALVRHALDWWKSLSPAEQEAHLQEQRASWVRGEMALSKTGLG